MIGQDQYNYFKSPKSQEKKVLQNGRSNIFWFLENMSEFLENMFPTVKNHSDFRHKSTAL